MRAREGTQNLKGLETLHSWPRAPGWTQGTELRAENPSRRRLAPSDSCSSLQPGAHLVRADLDPRMEDTAGTACGPRREVLCVLLETSRGDGEEHSTLAGMWKELM